MGRFGRRPVARIHKKFTEMLRDSAPLTPEFAAFARPIAEVVGLRFHGKPLTIRVRTEATKCVDHRFSQPERTPGASQMQEIAMNAYEKRIMPICVGAIAIASLSIGLARAADTPQANA